MSSDPLWQGFRAGEAIAEAIGGFFRTIWAIISAIFSGSHLRSLPKGREYRETRDLYKNVETLFAKTPLGQGHQNDFAVNLVFEAFERAGREPYWELMTPFVDTTVNLMVEEGLWSLPQVDWERSWGLEEGVELRKFLRAEERFFANYDRYMDIWREKLIRIYEGMLGYFPEAITRRDVQEGNTPFTATIIDLVNDAPEVIERLLATIWDKDVVDAGLYEATRERFQHNALVASGIAPRSEGATSRSITLPTKARWDTPSDLIANYLRGTAFEGLP